MKVRVISAIVAISIFAPLLYLGGYYFYIAMGILSILAYREIINLKVSHSKLDIPMILLGAILTLFICLYDCKSSYIFNISYVKLLLPMVLLLIPSIFAKEDTYKTSDAFYLLGSIYFIGDVVIHGDVDSGVEITATGSVTIGGTVQGSSVKAGENISINGGILGDERTFITCGGDLETRFIQYANVVAGGGIKAKSILDCTVRAGGMVIVEDTKGMISGGAVYSTQGIDGQAFGNRRGVKTLLSVGKSNDVLSRRVEYGKLIEELDIKLMGVNSREIQLGREAKTNPAMSNLLHIVRQNKARLLTEKKQIEAVYESIDRLYEGQKKRAYIEGRKFYPGVIIRIDMREKRITDEMIRVSFRGSEDGISFSYEKDDGKED